MTTVTAKALSWTETGMVPDSVIRAGIRRLLARKLREIHSNDIERAVELKNRFVAMMNQAPIALVPELANEQHYEVPAAFFDQVLGQRNKYSCCHWDGETDSLDDAERSALDLTIERAGIEDGMRILDLGCGWGSVCLRVAEKFPQASVMSVSNSRSQHDFITAKARERNLANIEVRVCDMNDFAAEGRFDRIVSVEMFEHMRNYGRLFGRIREWLEDDGRFFMHIFTHRNTPYEYVDRGPSDWMSRHFFSGGIMPSADLPLYFADDLAIERTWQWGGDHYARTCNAWLARMDERRDAIMPILSATYGESEAGRWWMRWRMFFMACAELFAFNDGQEWFVSHYRFRPAER